VSAPWICRIRGGRAVAGATDARRGAPVWPVASGDACHGTNVQARSSGGSITLTSRALVSTTQHAVSRQAGESLADTRPATLDVAGVVGRGARLPTFFSEGDDRVACVNKIGTDHWKRPHVKLCRKSFFVHDQRVGSSCYGQHTGGASPALPPPPRTSKAHVEAAAREQPRAQPRPKAAAALELPVGLVANGHDRRRVGGGVEGDGRQHLGGRRGHVGGGGRRGRRRRRGAVGAHGGGVHHGRVALPRSLGGGRGGDDGRSAAGAAGASNTCKRQGTSATGARDGDDREMQGTTLAEV